VSARVIHILLFSDRWIDGDGCAFSVFFIVVVVMYKSLSVSVSVSVSNELSGFIACLSV
jgi:hypothetical protein